jgi:hypothetical protein
MQCDDLHKTVISVDEQDEALVEFGGLPQHTPAERLGGEDDEEAA